ncbi:RICIN domain-containing protein [Streptomyces sp. NPDC001795]|uniref:RICIN domain-containing protein n=1 Tax=unclassified Streptomyces TaxID=2593676 RepID=UPI003323B489
MRARARPGRLALVAGIVLTLVLPLLSTAASQAASGKSLSVNLASIRGPSTGVGEGFLYGISEDGSQPADQFLQPLGLNAFRGGGWFSGGWIRDGYQYGSATRADVDSIIAQAKRLTRPPYHAQYQVLVSDIYIGDSNGYTGAASVTFEGLSSVPWLANAGGVHVTVHRIPDQAPLGAPQTVYDQNVSTSGGSITVPITFQGSHDAFSVHLTPASSSDGGFPDGYHPLVVASDNLCMDVYGDSGSVGAAIDQWTCNGQSNQQFRFVPASGGYGELRAQNSGLDVAVAGSSTAAGTPDIVQQAPGTAANSLWLPVRQSDGSYGFQNKNSGLCLDVYGAGSNPGQQLDQWQCKNTPGTNQDFILR